MAGSLLDGKSSLQISQVGAICLGKAMKTVVTMPLASVYIQTDAKIASFLANVISLLHISLDFAVSNPLMSYFKFQHWSRVFHCRIDEARNRIEMRTASTISLWI